MPAASDAVPTAPIGVFDSGVGGLSVLHDIRRRLPAEDLIYFADSGHCPYGSKTPSEIVARSMAITELLVEAGSKLIVVACNTATIAAVEHLRARFPVPFIGMEPAVKPAVMATRSGVVGVLATGAALGGQKFHHLVRQHARDVRIITQSCPGLVEHVEAGDTSSPALISRLRVYIEPLLQAGADVLVLGCTHYPFLRTAISKIAGPEVSLLDTGAAVARQTHRVLEREGLLASEGTGRVEWRCSGDSKSVLSVIGCLWQPGS